MELKKLQADLKEHLSELGHGRAEARDGAGGEDEDEAAAAVPVANDNVSEFGDGDADEDKRTRQSKQQATYESDDEEGPNAGEFDDAALEAEFEGVEESPDENLDAMDIDVTSNINGESQLTTVRSQFFANLKSSTSFNFADSGVKFDLVVSPSCFVSEDAY